MLLSQYQPSALHLQGSSSLKRSLPEENQTEAKSTAEEPAQKKPCMETDTAVNIDEVGTIEDRVRHSPRSCAIRSDDGAILRQCLEYLQKNLQT